MRNQRFAAGAVAALIGVMFMATTLVTPLYTLYRDTFHFSQITLTLIYAVYVVGNLAALMFFGRLSDQIGRRKVTFPVIGVGILSTLIYLTAENIAALFIARMLSGFAIGLSTSTGAAWLAELYGPKSRARATLMAIQGNLVGLSVGALMAGLLAQYAAWPLRLVFVVYVVMLIALLLLMRKAPETVEHPVASLREAPMTPRIGVPASLRKQFIAPAVAGFGGFALFGFYAALAPSILQQQLHETNKAMGGGVVFELCVVASAAVLVTRAMKSRHAMLTGLVLLLPALLILVLAQAETSLALLLTGTAVSGVATALCYRGSLQVVNEIAPSDRRAEIISTYLICCYIGNSLPVIGVGIISTLSGPIVASSAFAITIALFVVAALISGTARSARRAAEPQR
jgi:MFS family permease